MDLLRDVVELWDTRLYESVATGARTPIPLSADQREALRTCLPTVALTDTLDGVQVIAGSAYVAFPPGRMTRVSSLR